MPGTDYLYEKISFIMTINEKKQLSNYIKGLVQESISEMYGNEFRSSRAMPTNDEWDPEDDDWDDEEDDDEEIAGLNELRNLCEGMARDAVSQILMEKKGGKGWKNKGKSKKRKNKKEKTSSKDKTIVSKLNADGTNAAHYYYKLYGVENGTEAEKASARSKGYKKAKGKKNDTGVPYKFTSKEKNRLNSLLTDR